MRKRFSTKLKGYDIKGTGTFVSVPAMVMAAFAPRRRFPVKATLNGHRYRTTVVDMGDGPCFGVSKADRDAAGISRGDPVVVTIELDTEVRTVDVPDDFGRALGKRLRSVFDSMSYSHRKEYVMWVDDAKKPETRKRRIAKVIEKLREAR
jgi:hypothetical protein